MSDRITIGGTVYESIGSSNSNLLLKCNGTARILWGNKLIDLIKNGKIASEDSKKSIFIIQDESEVKSDGFYILNKENSLKFLISSDNNLYYFPEIPVGTIIMYSKLLDIPSGWVLCDGKEYEINGSKIKTPDLTQILGFTDYSLIFIMYMNYD